MSAQASAHATPRDLSLWIDGELSRQRAREVEAHVEGCGDCRQRYVSTLELVENLRGLERVAPPSTLGLVVEQHRLEVGNRRLRRRLERSWRRWPDPMILTYLALVVALGVMVLMVSDLELPGQGTVIRAPAHAPDAAAGATAEPHETWVEPGIDAAEVESAVPADQAQVSEILARLDGAIPTQARFVIARDGGKVVRVDLGEPTHD